MASFILSPLCRSIVVLSGAGMSVSSGIPDFRSAGSGMYDTLRPELLTASDLEREAIREDPTLALDREMFMRNPLPCLELKRNFILGTRDMQWRATIAHRFVELLHTRLGKLTRWYTQNIDGLEGQCEGIPAEKVVNVHGSMGEAACEACGTPMGFEEFCNDVENCIKDISKMKCDNDDVVMSADDNKSTTSTPPSMSCSPGPSESVPIICRYCHKPYVKPTIVLFQGSLPREFHIRIAEDLPSCDLLIVIGTSLTVAPANTLVYRVPPSTLRMVANDEPVGRRLGIRYGEEAIRDVFAAGRTERVFLDWAEQLGWLDDLEKVADKLPEASAKMLRERIEATKENESKNRNNDGDDGVAR